MSLIIAWWLATATLALLALEWVPEDRWRDLSPLEAAEFLGVAVWLYLLVTCPSPA